jgi:hypothetical protein
VYFYEHRKIFWILLWPKKEKTKQKAFVIRVAETDGLSAPHCS